MTMRLTTLLLAAVCGATTTLAHAAGLTFLQIPGGPDGPAIDAAVWSPCTTAPAAMKVRALVLPATPDCAIAGEKRPLVIISHGYGGWYLGHHDTAEALADDGFIVVAINHPHANSADMSRANGLEALIERPTASSEPSTRKPSAARHPVRRNRPDQGCRPDP
jgi:predicted dienelactone hydrolase